MNRPCLAFLLLSFSVLACGSTAPRMLNLYPTATVPSTQTPFVVTATRPLPSPSPTPAYPRAGVVRGAWNCREQPFYNSRVVGYLSDGEVVMVLTERAGWAQVENERLPKCWVVQVAIVSK